MLHLAMVALALAPATEGKCESGPGDAELSARYVEAEPGAKISFEPQIRTGASGRPPWERDIESVPMKCTANWRVSDPKLASIDPKTGMLTISPKAPPGSQVTLTVDFAKLRWARGPARYTIRIVDPNAVTPVGRWAEQSESGCAGKKVAELVFADDGDFTYTFPEAMIETQVSGSGKYRWEAGASSMTLDDQPVGIAMTRDEMVLTGKDFGGFANAACRRTFARTGPEVAKADSRD